MDLAALDLVPNFRAAALDEISMVENTEGGFNFAGHAAVFAQTADLGEFTEEILPGAFRSVLAEGQNIPLLHEHRQDQLLATTGSGRLQLAEDERGLKVVASMVKTDLSERVKALVDSGDLRGMSFGFVAGKGNSNIDRRRGKAHRTITGFKRLLDVTTTWDPAYVGTEAQFRTAALAGAYVLPAEPQDPRARRLLQLDEMEVRMRASDRRLTELGLI